MHGRPALMRFGFFLLSVAAGFAISVALLGATPSQAQTATSTLQNQIDSTNAQIKDLQDQIAKLQSQLTTTTAQKQTLQNAVAALNLNIQKLQKSITLAQTQINQKDSQIKTINTTISTTTSLIGDVQNQVADSLRQLQGVDNTSLLVALLTGGTLSSFFDESAALESLRTGLENKIEELNSLKSTLQTNKTAAQQKKDELAALQQTLSQQKQGLSITKDSQSKLLAQTKNQETAYQALLAQKQAEEKSFEATLIKLAAGLGSADTSSAPSPARGIIQWPLDSIRITQYFGNTEFAQAGAYNGSGHNGVDFGASIGTPVHAVLSGTVQEINQGSVKYCQYGKWVLVKHDNGLSSLYAHLSQITVAKGQRVSTGDLVGYSGDTGYATGPHLHLTVYISSAVSFKQYTCNSGSTAYIPIAPLNAYLNPLSYLPAIPKK